MTVRILNDDCISAMRLEIEDGSINCVVTSPPYFGLRDYGTAGQIGLERTPEEYVAKLVDVFRKVRRVLRDDGTVWLVLGDSYASQGGRGIQGKSGQCADRKACKAGGARERRSSGRPPPGLKTKDLIGIPWMVAFALRADGWYLRNEIIWAKPNPMPESVKDRCTKSHENMFLLTKKARYHCDMEAIKEPAVDAGKVNLGNKNVDKSRNDADRDRNIPVAAMRNKRDVWTVASQPYKGAHFATFPPKLIEPCILAGCPVGGTVLDPFGGAGTVGLVAKQHDRNAILIELNSEYAEMARKRIGL